ncbi:MAG: hypothetical protein KAI24_12345, partial [Planctomycetes bacterium]|nr:hypothetical protein [Planctomycetota bacterium]
DLQVRIDELQMSSSGEAHGRDPRLDAALSMRRPISRMLADICNSCGADLRIDELKFASKSPVVIDGHVEAVSRQAALKAMVAFSDKVRTLPFLEARGHEEVSEVLGRPNQIRFRIGLAWRNR